MIILVYVVLLAASSGSGLADRCSRDATSVLGFFDVLSAVSDIEQLLEDIIICNFSIWRFVFAIMACLCYFTVAGFTGWVIFKGEDAERQNGTKTDEKYFDNATFSDG